MLTKIFKNSKTTFAHVHRARLHTSQPVQQLQSITVDNPYTGDVYCEVPETTSKEAHEQLDTANAVQKEWQQVPLEERQELCRKWVEVLQDQTVADQIAHDITGQMGKPLQQSFNEINGTIDRAQTMTKLAEEALKPDTIPEENGLFRQITHEPVGVVMTIAPWNYPLMTAVNAVIPAVLAGNSVILKHSPRTPLCGSHYEDTFIKAGFPKGLVQSANCSHETAAELIKRPETAFVTFTGSVRGGHEVQQAASSRFINVNLELGGKDPAYVAEDADIEAAVAGLVDGACYNAGQSCCAVERIYVHESKYEEFLEGAKKLFDSYKLGNPLDETTSIGPMALTQAPKLLETHVNDAIEKGARCLTKTGITHDADGQGRFFQPTLLADCDHSMLAVKEESFGPIVAVSSVKSDEEAIARMNDTDFGLTASVFSSDKERALKLGSKLNAGTVFMNRCDCLDPYLPWSGRLNSGRGTSLSKYGFEGFTRLKGWNFRP